MKSFKLVVLLFLIAISQQAKSQWVTIPDANFVLWLNNHGFSSAMSGNNMDTTNSLIVGTSYLYIGPYGINNIDGLQYFDNLDTLFLNVYVLQTIPSFPSNLVYININQNNISTLPPLPNGLTYLDCRVNPLVSLPTLPNSLIGLECGNTQLMSLPLLPNSLALLNCLGSPNLHCLPDLKNISYLYADTFNHIHCIPNRANLSGSWLTYPICNLSNANGCLILCTPTTSSFSQTIACSGSYLFNGHNLNVSGAYNDTLTNYHGCDSIITLNLTVTTTANYVLIPDTNFVNWLNAWGFSSAMCGSYMDTTNILVIGAKNLVCTAQNITNLTGVSYFDSLLYLNCRINQLISLPALPNRLQNLDCDNNQLTALPVLPNGLRTLVCSYNPLTALPALPDSLRQLLCDNNQLTTLPTLPNHINSVFCFNNQLTALPTLPNSLKYLYCTYNQITTLPILSNSLYVLNCEYNQLTTLPALPIGLVNLSCGYNQLTALPAIPNSLGSLNCNSNQLLVLPALSSSLGFLKCDSNQLTSIPALPFLSMQQLICKNNPNLHCLPDLGGISHLEADTGTNILCIPNVANLPGSWQSFPICVNGNTNGCPVLPCNSTSSFLVQNICYGSSYSFKGNNLTTTGTYYDTLTNATGCDSFIVLQLLVAQLPIIINGQTINVCSGSPVTLSANLPSIANLMNWNWVDINSGTSLGGASPSSTISSITFTPSASGQVAIVENYSSFSCGGDSVNIIIYPQSNATLYQSICSNQTYFFNGNNLTVAGAYNDTLVNYHGCDSIITLNLTVIPISSGSFSQTICSNQPYLFNGNNLNTTGTYNDTLTNYLGCDSIITLNLTVNTISSSSFPQSICSNQTYFFNGNNLNATGAYNDTLTNYLGCDSIITLNLTVIPTSASSFPQSICSGSSFLFNGNNLTTAGAYNDTLVNYHGCDSIITLNLTVNPLPTASFTAVYHSCFHTDSCATLTYTGSAVSTYTWNFNGGTGNTAAQNPVVCFSTTGTHNINLTVTDVNGCSANAADTVALPINCVWPGDADNNTMADNFDVLAIGLGYGYTGNTRANASLNWIDQPCTDWGITQGSGADWKHADCNGDGIIDALDTLAISQNFGLVHPKPTPPPSPQPANATLSVVISPDTCYNGTHAVATINLNTLPTDSVYGLAFTFNYDPLVVDTNTVSFTLGNSWLFTSPTDHISLSKTFRSAGEIKVGCIRTDHTAKAGGGALGVVDMDITTDDIAGKGTSALLSYALNCFFTNVLVVGPTGNVIPVNLIADSSITMYEKNVGFQQINANAISIYPNPASDKIVVNNFSGYVIQQMQLVNMVGEVVKNNLKATTAAKTELNVESLPNGIYTLTIKTNGGVLNKKVVINR